MNKSMLMATALASGLLFLPLAQSSAMPGGTPALKSSAPTTPGIVLVGHGGGGGGGGGGGISMGGGGGRGAGGGGGFSAGHVSGGGWGGGGHGARAGAFASGGYGGKVYGGKIGGGNYAYSGRSFRTGKMATNDFSARSRTYSKQSFDKGSRQKFAYRGDRDRFTGRGDHKHLAMRDHDRDHRHGRHGHFVGGVWVWDYYPGYYAYDDCYYLRRQAIITGSPYWWNRYYACTGSYY
jgi:hypothetical protein